MTLAIGKRSRCNKAGFTLIELVLVILLISIITALSTPLFRRTFSDLVIRNAALDMSKLINYAQEMAIIDKVPYNLNLDFETNKYWLTKYGETEEGLSYERIRGRFGKDFFLPRGLSLISEKSKIALYPDGRSETAQVKIVDEKAGEGRELHIKGFGNRIKIEIIR